MAEEMGAPSPSQTPGTPNAVPAEPAAPQQPAAPAAPPSGDPTPGVAAPSPGTPAEPGDAPSVRVVPAVDEYKLPEGVSREVAEFAHKNDFTQAQLDTVLAEISRYGEATQKANQEMIRKAGEAHLQSFGDQASHMVNLARQALRQNDPQGRFAQMLETFGLGNHPAAIDFFVSIGKNMQEGGFLKSAVNKPPPKQTVGQLLFGDSMKQEN